MKKMNGIMMNTKMGYIYEAVRSDAAPFLPYRKQRSLENYEQHRRHVPNNLIELDEWLDEWQRLVFKCHQVEVGEVREACVWVKDFFDCLRPIAGVWADITEERVDVNTVTPALLVAKAKIYIQNRRSAQQPRGRLPGPNLGEGIEEEPVAGGRRRGRKRGGRSSRKAKKDANPDGRQPANCTQSKRRLSYDRTEKCRVCCRPRHDIEDCWYLFPKQAVPGWAPRGPMGRLIKRILRSDTALKADVEEIRARKKQRGGGLS
ncbi:hypothetical protein SODALDRAFT_82110 [Sodiomyces alkalinus F11]|uniref:Uncharacterized protein n=1 Tax=Sodiomyces alkalinus (strain CBS 110278 / VKM F-3762 / F11) TaxID=1314773 RepID=A0A3N2PJE8_SODAK|nr:hypothetical protein SODALDRAFT_82110 [Sodiomyces alkalinus F11]ROT34652.1 hypothetical protein SODALDRAFT_82110 [Sodiomyces alkalinus F11]